MTINQWTFNTCEALSIHRDLLSDSSDNLCPMKLTISTLPLQMQNQTTKTLEILKVE